MRLILRLLRAIRLLIKRYIKRVRTIGVRDYFITLFCLDSVGRMMYLMVGGVVALILFLDPGEVHLDKLPLMVSVLVLGRFLFHWKVGVFAEDNAMYLMATLSVVSIAVTLWVSNEYTFLLGGTLSLLLGLVGLILSAFLTIAIMSIGVCLYFFFPWMYMRGFKDKHEYFELYCATKDVS